MCNKTLLSYKNIPTEAQRKVTSLSLGFLISSSTSEKGQGNFFWSSSPLQSSTPFQLLFLLCVPQRSVIALKTCGGSQKDAGGRAKQRISASTIHLHSLWAGYNPIIITTSFVYKRNGMMLRGHWIPLWPLILANLATIWETETQFITKEPPTYYILHSCLLIPPLHNQPSHLA